MVWVTLGLGSNTDPANNITSCLDALLLQFRDMKLSSVFESAAEGSESAVTYLNMAVGFETELPLQDLAALLKKLEAKHGRKRDDSAADKVTLDIDVLTYANKAGVFDGISLPRPQILSSAYVLWPLSQVAASLKHPGLQENYATLWKSFSGDKSRIKPVNFEWHGRRLSSANA